MCCIFISDVEFNDYAPTRVQIRSEHTMMTYHAAVAKDWNKTAVDEDIYASDLTQEEEEKDASLTKSFPRILMKI